MSWTDCILYIGTDIVPASKFVLCNNSEYFRALFYHSNMSAPSLCFRDDDDIYLKDIVKMIHLPYGKEEIPPDKILNMIIVAQKYGFINIFNVLKQFLTNNLCPLLNCEDEEIIIQILDSFTLDDLNDLIDKIPIRCLPVDLRPCLMNYFIRYANKVGYIPQNLIRLHNRQYQTSSYIYERFEVKSSLRKGFGTMKFIYPDDMVETKINNVDYIILRICDLKNMNYFYGFNQIQCGNIFGKYPIECYENNHPAITNWNGDDRECILINKDHYFLNDPQIFNYIQTLLQK